MASLRILESRPSAPRRDALRLAPVPLAALIGASLALGAASLLVPSAPTTDPWGWIVWGREIVHLRLNTVAGPPSWKPLPVLATASLSLLGAAAPAAWLVVARAGGVLALCFAYRVATRLAGRTAGVLAAVGLALTANWLRGLAHGYSEGLAVALLLVGVECHLAGRRELALCLAALVSLARPEAWPLAAVYGAWFAATGGRRWTVAAALALPPLLWVLPDWWGSGEPLHADVVAQVNLRDAGLHPGLALLRGGFGLLPAPLWAAAAAGVALARRRRTPAVAVLGLAAVAWIALLAVATELRYPGDARFLTLPAALVCVVAAAGGVWCVQLAPPRRRRVWAAAVAVAALASAAGSIRAVPAAARGSVERARFEQDLRRSLARAGGPAVLRRDGRPVVPAGLWWTAGALAWDLRVPLNRIHKVSESSLPTLRGVHVPAVLFVPLGGTPPDDPGWRPTDRLARHGVRVTLLARAGIWRVFALTRLDRAGGAGQDRRDRRRR